MSLKGYFRASVRPHDCSGISCRTAAWFLCHRIREAMRDTSGGKLGGAGKIVEADELYVGGKPRKNTGDGRKTVKDRKTPLQFWLNVVVAPAQPLWAIRSAAR